MSESGHDHVPDPHPDGAGYHNQDSWGELVDQFCDEFEKDFRDQKRPVIEQYLERFPEAGRSQLFKELVPLEIDLFRETGIILSKEFYENRFPLLAELLKDIEVTDTSFIPVTPHDGDPNEVTADLKPDHPGYLVKHFRLSSVLGQGGFGTVWKAQDTRLQRNVAIKIPRRDRLSRQELFLFLREARAAAQLGHPNIVTVHEVGDGDTESSSFIVTELIDGPSLKVWLKENTINPRQAATLVATIAMALQHAHDQKIIHRDLKPGNVLMDARGVPHLADFGLAKREQSDESLSQDGRLLGTPTYMAPEQAEGRHQDVDVRTDIYSLGVILYEMLTGKVPFQGELAWLLEQISQTPPPPPRSIRSSVPEDLERICLKCLSKEKSQRYQTAQDLADDLHRYLNGESLRGVPIPFPKRIRKWAWRNRRVCGVILSTSLLCLGLAAGIWWWNQPVVFRRVVKFETTPPGCSITAVMLDPNTGEPDPEKITPARGKTPLKMSLLPGDYLIVAVLDDQRFTEVTRKVPGKDIPTPLISPHLNFRITETGEVEYPDYMPIKIPRPDVTTNMAFVEGSQNWLSPVNSTDQFSNKYFSIPPLFVDPVETTLYVKDSTTATSRYGSTISAGEDAGKRLPSLVELLYLQTLDQKKTNAGEPFEIDGLHSPPWEWTSTLVRDISPDERLSGIDLKRIAGGATPLESIHPGKEKVFQASTKAVFERMNLPDVGARYVRSARPRTRPEDFVRPVNSQ